MREHEYLSYAELIEALQALATEKRTGIMFIRNDTGHVVRIGLENGRVVSFNNHMYQGQKLISLIRQIGSGKFTFMQGVPGIVSGEVLPSSVDLFRELDFFRELAAAPGQEVSSAPPPAPVSIQEKLAAPPPPPPPPPVARQGGSRGATDLRVSGDKLFETVVHELTLYLGPIARMVVAEYEQELRSAMSGEQIHAIVSLLAQEIGDAPQAKKFEARIMGLVLN